MDAEARKILGSYWASAATADREDPEDVGIDRDEGWTVSYEQRGSGDEPERTVFNQRGRELDAAFGEKAVEGVIPWDGDINYPQHAFSKASDGTLVVALVANGPATGNATDPATDTDRAVWRPY